VSIKELLTPDETVINPHYMRQLLEYGIRLGQKSPNADVPPDQLFKDADVSTQHWFDSH
jgi:serine/threonine-protein kinase TTK/MPS1